MESVISDRPYPESTKQAAISFTDLMMKILLFEESYNKEYFAKIFGDKGT